MKLYNFVEKIDKNFTGSIDNGAFIDGAIAMY